MNADTTTSTTQPAPVSWLIAPTVRQTCAICCKPLEDGQETMQAFAGIHTACALRVVGNYINAQSMWADYGGEA
jgi:hypothetical protein